MRRRGRIGRASVEDQVRIVGILLAIIVGLVVGLVKPASTALLAIAIGLLVSVIGLQLSLQVRLGNRRTLYDGISDAVATTPWLRVHLEGLVNTASALTGDPRLSADAETSSKKFLVELAELADGHVRRPTWDKTVLLDLTRPAKHIRACSLQNINEKGDFWKRGPGTEYLQIQYEGIDKHRLTVERIWIYEPEGDRDAPGPDASREDLLNDLPKCLRPLVVAQANKRVQTWVIRSDDVEIYQRMDCVIWDDRCGFTPEMNSKGDRTGSLYSFAKSEVERLQYEFVIIKMQARSISASDTPVVEKPTNQESPPAEKPPPNANGLVESTVPPAATQTAVSDPPPPG